MGDVAFCLENQGKGSVRSVIALYLLFPPFFVLSNYPSQLLSVIPSPPSSYLSPFPKFLIPVPDRLNHRCSHSHHSFILETTLVMRIPVPGKEADASATVTIHCDKLH